MDIFTFNYHYLNLLSDNLPKQANETIVLLGYFNIDLLNFNNMLKKLYGPFLQMGFNCLKVSAKEAVYFLHQYFSGSSSHQVYHIIQGWKSQVFWCTKVHAPQSKFRRTLCTSKFCSPCDFSRYTCSPHRVPCCAPNEVSYGKMNQYNKILQFPHVKARRLSKKKKPRFCLTC